MQGLEHEKQELCVQKRRRLVVVLWIMPVGKDDQHAKGQVYHNGYRFVYKAGKRWQVRVKRKKQCIYVGVFDLAEDAARAVDAKVRELRWPSELLNFPNDDLNRPVPRPAIVGRINVTSTATVKKCARLSWCLFCQNQIWDEVLRHRFGRIARHSILEGRLIPLRKLQGGVTSWLCT